MSSPKMDWPAVEREAVRLLKALIRCDTTNPPGNEITAARLLADYFSKEGLEPVILESAPGRGNVVARLRGGGDKEPLLLTGHLDVVPAEARDWSHPPFAADEADGYIWGRGALDMKNMVAMSAVILALLKRSGMPLSRDVIFAAVADEEEGCEKGSLFLVKEHPELVRAGYALGEVGGFTMHINGKRIYPVMVAEKGVCWVRLRTRGEPGHASIPKPDSAVHKLTEALERLARGKMKQLITPEVERFVRALAETQSLPTQMGLRLLLNPYLSRIVVEKLIKDPQMSRTFGALLSNTATPTVLRAGSKTNVIPSEATCEIDGRLLPGQSEADFLKELRALVGPEVEIEVLQSSPAVSSNPNTALFEIIRQSVMQNEPGAEVIPYIIPGFTDAKAFSRLGTTFYGFAPMRLPRDVAFGSLFHGIDERIPVEGFLFGLKVLHQVVRRFVAGG